MSLLSVGDMARAYQMRNHNTQLKTTIATLADEVASGIKQDIGAAVGGDHRALASVNATLSRLDSYGRVGSEASLYLSTMQTSLDTIRSSASTAANGLRAASEDTGTIALSTGLNQAKSALDVVLGTLNTTVAGRHVFSGVDTGQAAVSSSDTLIAGLKTATAGLTTAHEIASAVDQWFDAPVGGGGYMDTVFGGSTKSLSGIQISDTLSISIPMTAADTAIRNTLQGLSLAALAATDGLAMPDAQRQEIATLAANRLMVGDTAIVVKQADLGQIESRVDAAKTRNSAEKTGLGLARIDMVGADGYETATALEAARQQLEILYTLNTKLSQLSLVNYL